MMKKISYEYRRYTNDWSEGSELCPNENVSERVKELAKIVNKVGLKKYRKINVN